MASEGVLLVGTLAEQVSREDQSPRDHVLLVDNLVAQLSREDRSQEDLQKVSREDQSQRDRSQEDLQKVSREDRSQEVLRNHTDQEPSCQYRLGIRRGNKEPHLCLSLSCFLLFDSRIHTGRLLFAVVGTFIDAIG
jgi:hypothetical protein